MSSSTSRFDPIPAASTSLSAWAWAAGIAAVVLLAIIGIVGAVDPFNSRALPLRFNIDRVSTYRQENVALWAALDIRSDPVAMRQQASVVVLGDSRGEQMRGGYNAARAFTILEQDFYDLSFGGASLYEMFAFFRHYRADFTSLETVIIVLPLSKLVLAENIHDRSEEALAAADNRFNYLLDHTMLFRSAQWLVSGPRTPQYIAPVERPRPDSAASLSEPLCLATAETAELTQSALPIELRQLENAREQWREVMALVVTPFLAELRAAGIEPVVVIPPLSPPVRDFMASSMATDVIAFEAAVSVDASVYTVPPSFEGTTGWSDAVHLCNESAMQILPMVTASMLDRDL